MKTKVEDITFEVPIVFSRGDDMILEFYVCETN